MSITTIQCPNANCKGVIFFDSKVINPSNITKIEGQQAYCAPICSMCNKEFLVIPSYEIVEKPVVEKHWFISNSFYGSRSEKIYTLEDAKRKFKSWCDEVYDDPRYDEFNVVVQVELWEVNSAGQEVQVDSKEIDFNED